MKYVYLKSKSVDCASKVEVTISQNGTDILTAVMDSIVYQALDPVTLISRVLMIPANVIKYVDSLSLDSRCLFLTIRNRYQIVQ